MDDVVLVDNIPREIAAAKESQRCLASIQIVENVEKHSNADCLEIVTILGWQVVVSM